jgi:hypothetical protein
MMIHDDFSWSPSPAAAKTTTVVSDSRFVDGLVVIGGLGNPVGFEKLPRFQCAAEGREQCLLSGANQALGWWCITTLTRDNITGSDQIGIPADERDI